MPLSTPLISADDLWRMPDGGVRRELVRGELRVTAPSVSDHGDVANNFAFLLTAHVKRHKLGRVFAAETGFRLARDPDTVVGADTAFIRAERIPAEGLPKGYWEGAPDVAAEVVSPHDTLNEVEEKVDAYLAAGAGAVVVINPRRQSLTVYRRGEQPLVRRKGETVDLSREVPGFTCTVDDVFDS